VFDIVFKTEQRWLICGGRDFSNREMFEAAMGDLSRMKGCPCVVIHGGAQGADSLAGEWARRMAIVERVFEADWAKHGNAAGPIRNAQMLACDPHLVIAFPGGKGTADMVRRARAAGIDVAEIKPRGLSG
jgi:hypothetical protein